MGINDRDSNLDLKNTPAIYGFLGASVPQVIYTSVTSTAATNTTLYPVSLTIPKATLQPGSAFRIILSGTMTTGTDTRVITLYLKDAAILTLTSGQSTALDWIADMMVASSGSNTQVTFGSLVSTGVDPIFDVSTATKDVIGGDFALKAGIVCTSANDTITNLYARVEFMVVPS